MKGADTLTKSKRLKNSKLAQLERKKKETEEFSEENEIYVENRHQIDTIMEQIDKFLYNDKK